MRIALAQINTVLGDFSGNREKIIQFTKQAAAKRCELVVFPEMTLMGYLPNDILERASVVDAQLAEFEKLHKQLPKNIAIVIGLVTKSKNKKGKPYFNSAAFLTQAAKPKYFHKQLLPTYDIFDEARHMEQGDLSKNFFSYKGKRLFITICEDIWGWDLPNHPTNYLTNPLKMLRGKKVDLVVNLSSSPFTLEKVKDRRAVVAMTAKNFRAPMVYVNQVGAQDEIIFDGSSFAVTSKGEICAQSPFGVEHLNVFDLNLVAGEMVPFSNESIVQIRDALVVGIRDFAAKSGLTRVHLGLSGGIDSAVVACLAVDAVGADNVTAVTLPGPFNEARSKTLAENLAANLKIRCIDFPINESYKVVHKTLQKTLGEFEFGVVNENLQARLRGVFLMAVSNKESSLLLTTGNKSEYATGYSTLYGDMCGGLAPIADLLKREVYALANLYNQNSELIPDVIITRPPSAELRPGQKDQDLLPPYDELDASVQRLVEFGRPAKGKIDQWLLPMMARSEFKRWQAPPILKISRHAFGRGRRMPITSKAKM